VPDTALDTYAAITTFNRKFLVRPARCRGRLSLLGNLDPGRPGHTASLALWLVLRRWCN